MDHAVCVPFIEISCWDLWDFSYGWEIILAEYANAPNVFDGRGCVTNFFIRLRGVVVSVLVPGPRGSRVQTRPR
jgi:hypothetical protein